MGDLSPVADRPSSQVGATQAKKAGVRPRVATARSDTSSSPTGSGPLPWRGVETGVARSRVGVIVPVSRVETTQAFIKVEGAHS